MVDAGNNQRAGKVEHFTDLEVWRAAHELFLDVLKDLDALPRTRAAAALTDQIIRGDRSIFRPMDLFWRQRRWPKTWTCPLPAPTDN